jgi:hypothetical protein
VVSILHDAFPDGMVRVAGDRDAVRREVTQRVRFDETTVMSSSHFEGGIPSSAK